jgi:hypothetical protein
MNMEMQTQLPFLLRDRLAELEMNEREARRRCKLTPARWRRLMDPTPNRRLLRPDVIGALMDGLGLDPTLVVLADFGALEPADFVRELRAESPVGF